MIDWKNARVFGKREAHALVIRIVDEDEIRRSENEYEAARTLSGETEFCLAAIRTTDWNRDLAPWTMAPVFGSVPFGDGAARTLSDLTQGFLPEFARACPNPDRRVYLCGYSLSGLFALWASFESGAFSGVAAVSPSLWYRDWIDYAKTHQIRTNAVYLSLGDREEHAKNKTLAAVGECVRTQYRLLSEQKIPTVLEMNPGNHFTDSDKRCAKGIAWLLQN